jgi:hypothetical protein
VTNIKHPAAIMTVDEANQKTRAKSNWSKLKAKLNTSPGVKKNSTKVSSVVPTEVVLTHPFGLSCSLDCTDKRLEERMRRMVVGLDCEMVGLGDDGRMSALARCTLVDFDGEILLDTFVQPKGFVTDFRTKYSGVRRGDIRRDKAVTLEEVCMR